jgi:surface antigen
VPAYADASTGNPCQPYLDARGYCTNYVYDRVRPPWGRPDAKRWTAGAQQHGWIVNDQPAPGAIVVFGSLSRFGHVAYVESVSGSEYTVSEMNWGTKRGDAPDECAVMVGFGNVTWRTLPVGPGAVFLHRPGSVPTAPGGGGGGTPPSYPPTGSVYPEGSLLRARGDAAVYVIEGGVRRGVPDPETFNARGYRWNRVREVSAQELASIPEGPTLPSVHGGPVAAPAPYPVPPTPAPSVPGRQRTYPLPEAGWAEGTLLRARGQAAVYVVQGGMRRLIPDESTFLAHGYRWENVLEVSPNELARNPEGSPLSSSSPGPSPASPGVPSNPGPTGPPASWPDGSLVRANSGTERDKVYVVENGWRRWVPDAETFNARGYRWEDVRVIRPDQIARIPQGQPLPRASASAPTAPSYPAPSAPTVPAPTGPPATSWPDGSLVRADSGPERDRVYVVQNGWRRWVPDAETFNARGYRWEDVRVIRTDQIARIPLGQPLPRASAPAPAPPPPVYTPPSAPAPSSPPLPSSSWRDGTLLRARGDDRVYVIENGRRRWVPDEPTFRARGYSFAAVVDVDRQQLNAVPEGPPLPRVSG